MNKTEISVQKSVVPWTPAYRTVVLTITPTLTANCNITFIYITLNCGERERERGRERKFHILIYIGIKHGFSCINIRQVPWEVLKTEAGGEY